MTENAAPMRPDDVPTVPIGLVVLPLLPNIPAIAPMMTPGGRGKRAKAFIREAQYAAIASMSAGPVPQHPPIERAPEPRSAAASGPNPSGTASPVHDFATASQSPPRLG